MRMRRRSRSSAVTDPQAPAAALPPELEARIAGARARGPWRRARIFDRLSWFWMMLFGVFLPLCSCSSAGAYD
jgi:hypothetical protein